MDFLIRFSKNSQILNLMKVRPVGAKVFHADRRKNERTEGLINMTKLMVAFRKFSNTPTNQSLIVV